uniref:Uncharacterized protein n=1 Tax=Chaetoceros debilis TaxID=122233 RepID=A0A7S3Q5Q2_9STRA
MNPFHTRNRNPAQTSSRSNTFTVSVTLTIGLVFNFIFILASLTNVAEGFSCPSSPTAAIATRIRRGDAHQMRLRTKMQMQMQMQDSTDNRNGGMDMVKDINPFSSSSFIAGNGNSPKTSFIIATSVADPYDRSIVDGEAASTTASPAMDSAGAGFFYLYIGVSVLAGIKEFGSRFVKWRENQE